MPKHEALHKIKSRCESSCFSTKVGCLTQSELKERTFGHKINIYFDMFRYTPLSILYEITLANLHCFQLLCHSTLMPGTSLLTRRTRPRPWILLIHTSYGRVPPLRQCSVPSWWAICLPQSPQRRAGPIRPQACHMMIERPSSPYQDLTRETPRQISRPANEGLFHPGTISLHHLTTRSTRGWPATTGKPGHFMLTLTWTLHLTYWTRPAPRMPTTVPHPHTRAPPPRPS